MQLGPAANAVNTPDKLALVFGDRRHTWREWNGRMCRLANGLRTLGLQPGDKVAVLLNNCPELIEVTSAMTKVGLTAVPLNYRLTAEEAQYIVHNSDARAFIFGSEFTERVSVIQEDLPNIAPANFIVVGRPVPGFERYEDLLGAHNDDEPSVDAPVTSPTMIYTSGTTGRPKGVARRGGSDPVVVMGIIQGFELGRDEVHLVCCPLYHSAPLLGVALTVALGGTLVIMPKFDAEEFLRLVEREKVTSTMAVPTVMKRLVALPPQTRQRYDVGSFRRMIFGAAPCPMETKRAVADFFGNCLYEYYGSTDAGLNTILPPGDQFSKVGSCGRILPGNDVKIFDDDGRELGIGAVGDVYIHSSAVDNVRYYKDPEKTRLAFRGRHMTVGDMGYVDADGYLYLVDRKIDMIISGGVNIYPAEIEALIHEHPAVLDCAVLGVPNDEWGEEVKAVVQLKDGASADASEILAFLAPRLADYKRPRSIDFVDEIPRNPSGKILKRELRKRYWENAGRSI